MDASQLRRSVASTSLALALGLSIACAPRAENQPHGAPEVPGPSSTTPAFSAPADSASSKLADASPPRPAAVEEVAVSGDLPAWIVRGTNGIAPHIVFLPGICSNAGAYLYGFAEAARAHGGVLALEGDRPCGAAKGFHSITSDPEHEEPRIEAALAAAGRDKSDSQPILLIGYSLGASLVEGLVQRFPNRYARVGLIGSPRDPSVARLKKAIAVVTMSCSLDVPGRMRGAVARLDAAGIAAKYFEMPGCTHGNLADGDRVLGDALGWLEGASSLGSIQGLSFAR
jgi:pimeloyl-ACP methyl ester carboxylesterase